MMAYWNGKLVNAAEVGLSLADAGLVYGAIITDFCRTYQHKLFRWPQHLARFQHDCQATRIPLNYSGEELTHAANNLVEHNARLLPEGHELALICFATPGTLGHLLGLAENGPPTLVLHTFPLNPERYQRFQEQGITLEYAGVLPQSPDLVPPSIKHRSRLSWYLAEQNRQVPGSVVCLSDDHLQALDTAIGSVLLWKNGELLRPPVGTVLESISFGVIDDLAKLHGWPFRQQVFGWEDLHQPGVEVWLVGSGLTVAPVTQLVDRTGNTHTLNVNRERLQLAQQGWTTLG